MSDEAGRVSKWGIALAAGAGVVVVLGVSALTYWALHSRRDAEGEAGRVPISMLSEDEEGAAAANKKGVVKVRYAKCLYMCGSFTAYFLTCDFRPLMKWLWK